MGVQTALDVLAVYVTGWNVRITVPVFVESSHVIEPLIGNE